MLPSPELVLLSSKSAHLATQPCTRGDLCSYFAVYLPADTWKTLTKGTNPPREPLTSLNTDAIRKALPTPAFKTVSKTDS